MPVIEILESRIGPLVRVPGSGPLMDVCDEAHAPVDFSCRAASCGTCRVEVLAGGDLLEPPRADELAVLVALASPPGLDGSGELASPNPYSRGASGGPPPTVDGGPSEPPPGHRLACQAVVRPGPGLLRLRWVGR